MSFPGLGKLETCLVSSMGKEYAHRFNVSFPNSIRGIKRLYLLGYEFYDPISASAHTGAIIIEIRPFRFAWLSETGHGEARLTLPAQSGVNSFWFPDPLLIANTERDAIPPLKDLEVEVWRAPPLGSTSMGSAANLHYLHLWLAYEK